MLDFIEKIPEFLKLTWADLSKVLIGAFMSVFLAYGWVRSIRKATKAQIRAEEHKLSAERASQRADFDSQQATLREEHATKMFEERKRVMEAEQGRQAAEIERTQAAAALTALQARLSALETFDGKLWEQALASAPPEFACATRRKTRFIAIVNLKGGVGKTTLTANLGVGLARRDQRVLLVDLDFQGSLTRLCTTSGDQLMDLIRKKRTSAHLLDGQARPETVADISQRISHPNLVGKTCDFIAADESLAEAELRAQARWLVTKTPDARFLFRGLFHADPIVSQYDLVLFDCPPRLTTACINALACADFVLVPVLLEQGSVEALPRTLNWLKRLPHVTQARLLGVVANRVDLYRGRPVSAQQTILNFVPEAIKSYVHNGSAMFQAIVKNSRALIEEAANRGQIAAADDDELFASVVSEVEKGVRG